MHGIFAGVTMSQLLLIINSLGVTGLVVIFWYVDQRRLTQQHQDHKEMVAGILKDYKADVDKIAMFYERNVELVQTTQTLAEELTMIIQLNTKSQIQLVESIKNNQFCPMARAKGPERN